MQLRDTAEGRGEIAARDYRRGLWLGDRPWRQFAHCSRWRRIEASSEHITEAPNTGDRHRRHRHTVLVHRERFEDIVVVRLVHAVLTIPTPDGWFDGRAGFT